MGCTITYKTKVGGVCGAPAPSVRAGTKKLLFYSRSLDGSIWEFISMLKSSLYRRGDEFLIHRY